MNIFRKVTLESMKKSRTRTVVTVIGVILSAAMVTAVATFAVSLQAYMIESAALKYGGWHVEFPNVDAAFAQERAADEGTTDAAVVECVGYAALEGGQNPDKPYLYIAGFRAEAFDTLPITLVKGRLPENSGEILVPAHVAANGGVKISVGDTLTLPIGSRVSEGRTLGQNDPYAPGAETLVTESERSYTVVGVCQRPTYEAYAAPGYTLITVADPELPAARLDLFVTLDDPRTIRSYVNGVATDGAELLNDDVLRFAGLSGDSAFNALLYACGGVLIALIMLGSVFLIYNSFNISLNERTQQFGILSSVGATAKQLRDSVLFEGLCIGAVGIPVGVAVGVVSIRLVLSVVARNFSNMLHSEADLTLTVSVPAIVCAVLISLVTILISAYIPARRAAGTSVIESIRQTNEIRIESASVRTSKLVDRVCGLEGTLARKNFKRNRKRYRSIVLSLTLSVVLFVAASAFGRDLKQLTAASVMDTDYDVCFYSSDMDDEQMFDLYELLKTAAGVRDSLYQAVMSYTCTAETAGLSERYRAFAGLSADGTVELPMDVQFIEDDEYLRFLEELGLPAGEYTGENAKLIAAAKAYPYDEDAGDNVMFDMFGTRNVSCTLTPVTDGAPAAGQSADVTFVDTVPLDTLPWDSDTPYQCAFIAVVPWQLKDRFEAPGVRSEQGLTFLSEDPALSTAQMENLLQGTGITFDYTLYNVNKIMEENRNILFIVDVFTYVFTGMISLIAVANVFNTISTNIGLRRRELAMLRSVGMSDRAFNRMMRFECALYGTRTLLFGLPLAGLISWLIYKGLSLSGENFGFTFPWGSIAVSVFGVFFVVSITMLYATGKLKKENIIDALRDDLA